ncbi:MULTISPECIES: sucrose-6-phosphate hydrolase [Photorhabdus]|uniref:Sucrose-6-phosphate hydrolase n=2 Tax=Photorhabdus asymbiotica TaxID=291112 RepID=B6VK81_PHOAA|nr:sucrose-6-phosphate hydrolase [Photorhabdus asymbiotica]RKS66690.1 beta-fructofuranosidase [Photorhabdus asymbiotica]CAQ83353.1 sucrose-6-phosphate hydrolase [Photorhabdus asymbiotica]CAR66561.1 sucrose-6-phosphate hydrolase [Photorhabdus asymbiotica subsp. asymbiotica ATCC 43949]
MQELSFMKQTTLALMNGQQCAAHDPHRPVWHLAPAVGLLNDPNGFIQHNGVYHLFYQWNPLACDHKHKCWGHWQSTDLVHWQHQPVALLPGADYDKHGCYSGSAVEENGNIILVYSGNVKYPDGSRTTYQCLARKNECDEYDKIGPVLPLPVGYSGHVRDPKVWRYQDNWYMVLGARDLQDQGKVLLLRSTDLYKWQMLGEIAGSQLNGMGDFGYMWECPDLFTLGDTEVLICCPQGLEAQNERYLNTYQAGYLSGKLDYQAVHFTHGEFHELDAGFEFYAPQTTQIADGRRLLIGWMGVPDQDEQYHPTIRYGWIHTMTCPRELTLCDGKLYQQPVRELQQLRGEQTVWQGVANDAPPLDITSAELILVPQGLFNVCFGDAMQLTWDGGLLSLIRNSLCSNQEEHRYWRGTVQHLQIMIDRSSVEIFINHGEAVMSSRYFPTSQPLLHMKGKAKLALQYWPLMSCLE